MDSIWTVLIPASAVIIAAVINSATNFQIAQKQNRDQRLPRNNFIWWRIATFLILAMAAIFLGWNIRPFLSPHSESPWVGDWIEKQEHYEGEKFGTLTFWMENDHLRGLSHNANLEPVYLTVDEFDESRTKGTWWNHERDTDGQFEFNLAADSAFTGFYYIKNKKKYWNGERIDIEELDKQIAVIDIGLRTSPFTSKGYNSLAKDCDEKLRTEIAVLVKNDRVKILNKEKDSFKVLAKSDGILKIGFVAVALSGEKTLK